MTFCPKCGKTVEDNASFCTGCGNNINSAPVSASEKSGDSATIAEIILAFFCPVAGDALYRKYKKDKPKAAKTIIWTATGGLLFWGLICTVYVLNQ